MTELNQNEAAAANSAKDKPKTVAADMGQRVIFTGEDVAGQIEQYLAASAERYSDFGKIAGSGALVIAGLKTDSETGEQSLDRDVYNSPDFEGMVTLLRKKGAAGEVKAIVVAPIPTVEGLAGLEAGSLDKTPGIDFIRAIIRKELNHRAVRALREAENVASVADQIPTTIEGYISSSRDAGGLLETFNELYKDINTAMSGAVPAWAKRRFIKQELRKAMESKGYALDTYPELEESGKNGSLFEKAIALGIATAKRKGLDTTLFDRWLETRATKTYTADDADADDIELDIEGLTESLLAEPAEGEAAADDATENEAAAPAAE